MSDKEKYVPRLRRHYAEVVKPQLIERFGYTNPMQVPRLEKIVLNIGIGAAAQDSKLANFAAEELTKIAGQKAVITRARKSIHGFKVRKGMPVGVMVTLRKERMWDFLERLINVALPRVRDFKGLSPRHFDGRGNYTFGLSEQLVWPEIPYEMADKQRGMDITIVTTAETDEEAYALLEALGFPFRKK